MKFLENLNISDGIALPNRKIKLAITGLSRSGKTVFITSLINQIIAGDRLEMLKRKSGKQFLANIVSNESLKLFNYEEFSKSLRAENPSWPVSTSGISALTLRFEVKSSNRFIKNRFLDVEIIDYPGEWLLDIPMLNQSFEEWSEFCFKLSQKEPRDALAKEFIDMLNLIDTRKKLNEEVSNELYTKYKEYLLTCKRSEYGLNLLQPGRFVMGSDTSVPEFTPLPPLKGIDVDKDSYYMVYKNRYNEYVNRYVKKFNLDHFSKFDRQVVLVDVLKTLKNGYECFDDMLESIKMIMSIYSYGRNSFISKLFQTKIDKVIFCATKADHVANNQHNNYRSLLELIVEESRREIDIKGVKTLATIISSIKSTTSVSKEHNGRRLSCLKGKLIGEDEESIIFPGEIPEAFPTKEEWDKDYFDFPDFAPISFPPIKTKSVANIRMDEVIYHLIGDKL
jgi:hypothetical protein